MYDYLEQVTADVRDYVEQEIDLTEWAGDRDGLEEKLNDDLWTVSYTHLYRSLAGGNAEAGQAVQDY